MIERLGQLLVFVARVDGASYIELSFGHVIGQGPQLSNRSKNQTLCNHVESHHGAGAADETGHDDPDAVHNNRFAHLAGKVTGLNDSRTDHLVEHEGTGGPLGIMAG